VNLILSTDSYKQTHWKMYPPGTEYVYSYYEARKGAKWDHTVFFGLQSILERLAGVAVTQADLDEAAAIAEVHFGDPATFNRAGWQHIINVHGGRLPLEIRAVPEGKRIPNSNVLMTVVNTDPECFWLTNYVESYLTHVWYPSTVATLSHEVKRNLVNYLRVQGSDPNMVNFMLHDFGYRGATTDAAAAIGGAAHLVNFMGTDTLPAMALAMKSYSADLNSLAFSVPATEHSVMTALGREGELDVLDQIISQYPSGILSVVADSYNIYDFVKAVVDRKDQILDRGGRFVVRPDSITAKHETPEALTLWIVEALWDGFGGTYTPANFRVLNDQVRVLWGDGIDSEGINSIVYHLHQNGYAAENMVFGMGGGLLQKVNRDTQRFAFKSSAQYRDGAWHDVQKDPLDPSKASKAGRLMLIHPVGERYRTVRKDDLRDADRGYEDLLETVFLNGEIVRHQNFSDIRANAVV
jgi:nicotinamide phosphoribosyltransferase